MGVFWLLTLDTLRWSAIWLLVTQVSEYVHQPESAKYDYIQLFLFILECVSDQYYKWLSVATLLVFPFFNNPELSISGTDEPATVAQSIRWIGCELYSLPLVNFITCFDLIVCSYISKPDRQFEKNLPFLTYRKPVFRGHLLWSGQKSQNLLPGITIKSTSICRTRIPIRSV